MADQGIPFALEGVFNARQWQPQLEAQITQQVNHGRVCRRHGFCSEQGVHYVHNGDGSLSKVSAHSRHHPYQVGVGLRARGCIGKYIALAAALQCKPLFLFRKSFPTRRRLRLLRLLLLWRRAREREEREICYISPCIFRQFIKKMREREREREREKDLTAQ